MLDVISVVQPRRILGHTMTSFPARFEVGSIAGDYQIISGIGRGGMGEGFQGPQPHF